MSQVWPWSIALDFWLKTRQILLKDPTIANLMKCWSGVMQAWVAKIFLKVMFSEFVLCPIQHTFEVITGK
jgi:hypothetical protein